MSCVYWHNKLIPLGSAHLENLIFVQIVTNGTYFTLVESKIHYQSYKKSPLAPILNQMNAVYKHILFSFYEAH